jgi:hypothetical protein
MRKKNTYQKKEELEEVMPNGLCKLKIIDNQKYILAQQLLERNKRIQNL